MELSQDTWVQRLKENGTQQSEAIEELRGILMKRLGASFHNNSKVDSAFIEDTVQEGLVKILKSIDQFEGRSKFTTWATTIAIRLAFTELRRKRWKDVSLNELVESQGEFLPASSTAAVDQTDRQRILQAMHKAIQEKLTEKQKTALTAELAGMPLEEIGRRTGSNRNAIYKLLHDARKRLRKELESNGFTAAEFQSLQENNA